MCIISFTLLVIYSASPLRGQQGQYPLYRRLGGPQSQSGHYGEKKNLLPLLGIESWLVGLPACNLIAILSELSRLRVLTAKGKKKNVLHKGCRLHEILPRICIFEILSSDLAPDTGHFD
jgi:hypothetical protein